MLSYFILKAGVAPWSQFKNDGQITKTIYLSFYGLNIMLLIKIQVIIRVIQIYLPADYFGGLPCYASFFFLYLASKNNYFFCNRAVHRLVDIFSWTAARHDQAIHYDQLPQKSLISPSFLSFSYFIFKRLNLALFIYYDLKLKFLYLRFFIIWHQSFWKNHHIQN